MPKYRPPPISQIAPWVMLLITFAVGYPWLISSALERFGVQTVAGSAFALGCIATAVGWRRIRASEHPRRLLVCQLGGLALLLVASVIDDVRPILMVPALVQLFLATLFWQSLSEAQSTVERGARHMEPHAPVWISDYCRATTRFWSVFFFANAGLITALALQPDRSLWSGYTGGGLYLVAMGIQGIEFFVRKIHFRYYPGFFFMDGILRSAFPPEKTERGRRSMRYMRETREEFGMEPPP